MHLIGARGQIVRDHMFDASGTIIAGTTAQLILPERQQNSSLYLENLSSGNLLFEIGGARATATLTAGVVTSIAVTNAGFGYTVPPNVVFYGGGSAKKNPNYLCPGFPGNICPDHIAQAHAVLTGGAVSSIVIDFGGSQYVEPPMVFLQNSDNDPYGCAVPSATSGILLAPTGGAVTFNGTVCTTDAIAVYGATTGQAYCCKYTIGS